MTYQNSLEQFANLGPDHIGLLEDTLHAPSAHNAQPWIIRPQKDGQTYELHYDQSSDLPTDLDDKDAYLTMGAFVETMVLQAPNHGLDVAVAPELTRDGRDLFIARVAIGGLVEGAEVDPLSSWVSVRTTNRNRYQKDPLPPELELKLEELGNVLVDPKELKDVVAEASIEAWANPQYVRDLQNWMRKNNDAEDGMTPAPFNLSKLDLIGLELAYRRGSINSKLLAQLYSSSEVSAFTSAPKAAVLAVPETTPLALFEAGRVLLRSWVEITAAGYSSQPFSVAVDERSAASRVAEIANVEGTPVSLYRVGKAAKPPRGTSNRKPLHKVLV